jgi:hypothetical protein
MLMAAVLEVGPGMSAKDKADMVGVSTHTIRKWERDPAFQRYQTWYIENKYIVTPPHHPSQEAPVPAAVKRRQLREEISEYAEEMFDRLKSIIETTEDEKLVVATAQDIMDRAGHAPQRTVTKTAPVMLLTPEALALFNQRAIEAGHEPVIPALSVTRVLEGETV